MSQETLDTIVILVGLAGGRGFVIGLHYMNSPATARTGNRLSAVGMALAVVVTFAGARSCARAASPPRASSSSWAASSSVAPPACCSRCAWR